MFDKYIDIQYKHNSSNFSGCDCYGLFRLIYKEERNIILPSFVYSKTWCEEGEDHIVKNVNKEFYKIHFPYKLYDGLIFFSSSNIIADHIGMYIGDNKFIHVYENSTSMISKLDDYYKNKLYGAFRYKEEIVK